MNEKKRVNNDQGGKGKPVSLYPLEFEDAIKEILKVSPKKDRANPKKK